MATGVEINIAQGPLIALFTCTVVGVSAVPMFWRGRGGGGGGGEGGRERKKIKIRPGFMSTNIGTM